MRYSSEFFLSFYIFYIFARRALASSLVSKAAQKSVLLRRQIHKRLLIFSSQTVAVAIEPHDKSQIFPPFSLRSRFIHKKMYPAKLITVRIHKVYKTPACVRITKARSAKFRNYYLIKNRKCRVSN